MKSAIVLFSGGLDSTVALAWALERYERVETIGFDYGQRHRVELDCRTNVRREMMRLRSSWAERMGEDRVVRLDLPAIGALMGDDAKRSDGLSDAFIPGRNLMFLLQASILAETRGIGTVVGGMCEADFRGFPDCRFDTICALQVAVNLGMGSSLRFETPIMQLSKRKTWWLAADLGGESFVNMIAEETHTCYAGNREFPHAWGYGCGDCDPCALRREGWQQFCADLAS